MMFLCHTKLFEPLPKSDYPKKKGLLSFWKKIIPGRRKVSSNNIMVATGSRYIPKNNPLKPQGEDAHFLLEEFQTFGVADGVGSWAGKGIDSGEYARQLMFNTRLAIMKQKYPLNPREALKKAFYKTNAKGSSTACIITVHDDQLHAVNIGDSGFVHIRGGKIIYASPVQQRRFNCPYQLHKGSKDIHFAEEIKRFVEPKDVIVAGTDGLFDNVHREELEELVRKGREDEDMPKELARKITNFALKRSQSRLAVTPFALERQKAGNIEYIGGKNDDITVVVAYIFQPLIALW